MSHQWTMEDFESIYSRFKSSGLSVMDFCSNECIRPKRFYEWRSKLLRKGGFIPVKVNSKGFDTWLFFVEEMYYCFSVISPTA